MKKYLFNTAFLLFFTQDAFATLGGIEILKLHYGSECDSAIFASGKPWMTGVVESDDRLLRFHYAPGKKDDELILRGLGQDNLDDLALPIKPERFAETQVGKKAGNPVAPGEFTVWTYALNKKICNPIKKFEVQILPAAAFVDAFREIAKKNSVTLLNPVATEDFNALAESPFIELRTDQAKNPYTDGLFAVGYTFVNDKAYGRSVSYTSYFSDEDSKLVVDAPVIGLFAQFKGWGRGFDIKNNSIHPSNPEAPLTYQKGSLYGIGHTTDTLSRRSVISPNSKRFKLDEYVDADHEVVADLGGVILQNDRGSLGAVTSHNLMTAVLSRHTSDVDSVLYGYHYLPKRLSDGRSREQLVFDMPWFLQASKNEQIGEGKFPEKMTQSMVIEIQLQKPVGGAAKVSMFTYMEYDRTNGTQEIFTAKLGRVGHDFNHRAALVTLPLSESILQALEARDPSQILVIQIDGNEQSAVVPGFRYMVPDTIADRFKKLLKNKKIEFRFNAGER